MDLEACNQSIVQEPYSKKNEVEYKEAFKVLFEKSNVVKPVYLKPLYLYARIEGIDIGRVLVDNGVTVNILPLCMLNMIGKSMEDLILIKIAISGIYKEIL